MSVFNARFTGSSLSQSALERCRISHAGSVTDRPLVVQLPDLRIDELDIGDVRTHCLAKISNRVFFFVDGDLGVFGISYLALSVLFGSMHVIRCQLANVLQ